MFCLCVFCVPGPREARRGSGAVVWVLGLQWGLCKSRHCSYTEPSLQPQPSLLKTDNQMTVSLLWVGLLKNVSLRANSMSPDILKLALFKYKIKYFQIMAISLNEVLLINSDCMFWERCLCLIG